MNGGALRFLPAPIWQPVATFLLVTFFPKAAPQSSSVLRTKALSWVLASPELVLLAPPCCAHCSHWTLAPPSHHTCPGATAATRCSLYF